jgi:hypothetical protein
MSRRNKGTPKYQQAEHYQKETRKDAPKGKTVRYKLPSNFPDGSPIWSFALIDMDGPFGWRALHLDHCNAVMERLKCFEKMTWQDIYSSGSHNVTTDGLSWAAQKRLTEINQDANSDLLFSLRVTGAQRIWGLRMDSRFFFLWWDPEHQVYPYKKPNT